FALQNVLATFSGVALEDLLLGFKATDTRKHNRRVLNRNMFVVDAGQIVDGLSNTAGLVGREMTLLEKITSPKTSISKCKRICSSTIVLEVIELGNCIFDIRWSIECMPREENFFVCRVVGALRQSDGPRIQAGAESQRTVTMIISTVPPPFHA